MRLLSHIANQRWQHISATSEVLVQSISTAAWTRWAPQSQKNSWSSLDPLNNFLSKQFLVSACAVSWHTPFCLYFCWSEWLNNINNDFYMHLWELMHFGVLSKSWFYQTAILGHLFKVKLLKYFQCLIKMY